MIRYYFVITVSMPLIIYYIYKIRFIMRHTDWFSEEYRYGVASHMISVIMINARIRSRCSGIDKLPKDGGYIMISNHQGKFDVPGIMHFHKSPCSVVIDKERSKQILLNEFIDVVDGIRLDKNDIKQQYECLKLVAERVKNGKKIIIFPEGGYDNNGNNLLDFIPGTFKVAIWSKMPIVPVALVDSYKAFGLKNGIKRVTTQVHFLDPIYFEDYKGLKSAQIAEKVKGAIEDEIKKHTA